MNTSHSLPSPCFLLDERLLKNNLSLVRRVAQEAEVDIILALKGFALWKVFPIVREYIPTASASSLHEVMLCHEHLHAKAHTYAPAYKANEIHQILESSKHITFNTLQQYELYAPLAKAKGVSIGLRINPEYTDVTTDLYNPALPGTRLGMSASHLAKGLPKDIEGLHVHALCESDSYALAKMLEAIEAKFGYLLPHIRWLNLGGGHLMTDANYNTSHLIALLQAFKAKHDLAIILEPGSALVWQVGTLKTTILDLVKNHNIQTAIIDASFTCHLPDCLEMPYRPEVKNGHTNPNKAPYQYRIGGISCLAGDFLEAYSFKEKLRIGDEIEFMDMAHYTMVKTTTFNGIQHPSIAIRKQNGAVEVLRTFDYQDYRDRLS